MNTEAMLALASHIETVERDAFDMSEYYRNKRQNLCGYAACVAGWAVLSNPIAHEQFIDWQLGIGKHDDPMNYPFHNQGMKVLGLTSLQADVLFTSEGAWAGWLMELDIPWGNQDEGLCLEDITPKHAVEVLRGLATGEITFPHRRPMDEF